jgi:4,5:9,10-diseco-3-hydroxy-5,9,17-trioxoandrosta-1(10),2-diene-4-oate hydrolase
LFTLPRRFRAISTFEKRTIEVEGISTGYLTAGVGGPPLVLLHGVGTSAGEWTWMLPDLARDHLVYAVDLPGYDGSSEPPDYSPAFTARFIGAFLDAVGVEERAVVVGNSFGGLVALHLALSEPGRVCALVLADSAGLGQAVNPAVVGLTLPGSGRLVAAWENTPPGAYQRAFRRALLMFARPWQVPPRWLVGQYKVAQVRNFTETTLHSLRTAVGLMGQREVLLERLPRLRMPTLVVWGIEDRVIPYWHANAAVARLRKGALKLIPNCGHLPHVERPKRFVSILSEFLGGLRSS